MSDLCAITVTIEAVDITRYDAETGTCQSCGGEATPRHDLAIRLSVAHTTTTSHLTLCATCVERGRHRWAADPCMPSPGYHVIYTH